MDATTCQKTTSRELVTGYSRRCGRPLLGAEQVEAELCGIHLAGKRRSEANAAARKAQRNAQDEAYRASRLAVARVREATGLGSGEVWSYSGAVCLSPAAAERFAELAEFVVAKHLPSLQDG
jgi:hypothetical protein